MSATALAPVRPADAVIHPPSPSDERRVIELADGRMARVSPAIGQLWTAIDGAATAAQLADRLGEQWTPELVHAGIEALLDAHLIDSPAADDTQPKSGGGGHKEGAGRRFRLGDAGALQLTLFKDLDKWRFARWAGRVLGGRAAACLALGLGAAGFVNMIWHWNSFATAVSTPTGPLDPVLLLLAMVAATSLHELGHAVRAINVGGRVRRVGVMLLYLSPAMFCDITDTWRLSKQARVTTALAGGAASAAIAGACSLAFSAAGSHSPVLAALALAMSAMLVVNLLPLVKFDGYIALMSHLDLPNLRQRAMLAWKTRLAAALRPVQGDAQTDPLLDKPWAVPYGLAASAAPLVLLFSLATQLGASLAGMGALGVALRSCIVLAVLVILLRGAWRTLAALRRAGVAPIRTLGLSAGVTALTVTGLLSFQIPQ
ncbi:MAG: hypothetical protein LBO20_10730, partial [Bifidobacteriaceae bacterium]|nr:hypothetical protein [Bifidobacteriaceae bacterium]